MLSILTFNIWNYEGPWEQRLPLIREWIRLLDPDLIGMQEVLLGETYDQPAEIFEGFGYYLEYASAMPYWNDASLQIGNLIASRWPVRQVNSIALPDLEPAESRVLLGTVIDSPHGTIPFYTTHLSSKPSAGYIREQQIQVIAQTIRESRDEEHYPDILCGDFNASPDSTEMRFMRGLHSLGGTSFYMMDAWEMAGLWGPGYTFSRHNTWLRHRPANVRLDYIYVSRPNGRAGQVTYCGVVCDVPRRDLYPSDHFGVYAELSTDENGT